MEFDITGATYYAVAPSGYTYSSEQTTNYDTRKYNTLAAAAAALPATATAPLVINILDTWSSAETTIVTRSLTTSATNFLLIRTIDSARHEGKWTTTAWRLEISTNYRIALTLTTQYAYIEGLQISNSATTGSGCFRGTSGSNRRYYLNKCIFKTVSEDLDAVTTSGSSSIITVTSSLFIGSVDAFAPFFTDGAGYVYNCTFCSFYYGVFSGSGLGTYKNNGFYDVTSPIDGEYYTEVTNSTSTPVFVSIGTGDFHLDPSDTVWKGNGTDLSSDSFYPITEDIDGDAFAPDWSIGADSPSALSVNFNAVFFGTNF